MSPTNYSCSAHLCVFTARCTLVQSAVLRSHVVCPSIRPSVTLVDCDHIGWNSEIISPLVSLRLSFSADPKMTKGNTPKFAQSDPPPPLCWFERRRHSIANCGRMVTVAYALSIALRLMTLVELPEVGIFSEFRVILQVCEAATAKRLKI